MHLPNRIVRFSQLRLCGRPRGIIAAVRLTSTSMKLKKQRYSLTSLGNENSIFAGTGRREFALFICIQFRL
jgi:hypothetical protein